MNSKVEFIESNFFLDDRGYLQFANGFSLEEYKRLYIVENHQANFVRAWHGHKVEAKAFFCISGEFKIGLVDPVDMEKPDTSAVPEVFFLGERKPGILLVPSGYANGIQNLTRGARLMVFSSSTVEESMNDDFRFDWDTWDIWTNEFR